MSGHPSVWEGPASGLTEDRIFAGALRLFQPEKGNRAGTDGVVLAAAIPATATKIADLGAGTGIIGLRAAQMNPQAMVHLFETEPATADLCAANILANGLEERVHLERQDVTTLGRTPAWREVFDCIVTNPPFHDPARTRAPQDEARALAFQVKGGLGEALDLWVRNAVAILAPKGLFLMIHRAEAIEAILPALSGRLGNVCLTFIHPKRGESANRVLIGGIKGSRAPLAIRAPIILHEADGTFTPEARQWHEGSARLA